VRVYARACVRRNDNVKVPPSVETQSPRPERGDGGVRAKSASGV